MKNSYYLITLQDNKTRKRLDDFLSLGKKEGRSNELLHYCESKQGDKIIVQGDIDSIIETFILGKSHIEYLGDLLGSGQAEQKVYDFISQHKSDWDKA